MDDVAAGDGAAETFKVLGTRVEAEAGVLGAPGTVIEAGPRLVVACAEGAVEVVEAQREGKRRMAAGETPARRRPGRRRRARRSLGPAGPGTFGRPRAPPMSETVSARRHVHARPRRPHRPRARLRRVRPPLLDAVGRVVVGQPTMVERLLIGLLTGGHVLLEGVPGLAKTLAVSTLARAIDAQFQRIQFTPDLLPADLVGTLVYNQGAGDFIVKKGPVFANIVLADEINRAPAKVQSALLEAMQERQVTIGDTTYPLPDPFLVLATQNPVEQEGTYPLPEAQVDRFMLKTVVTYPTRDEELAHPAAHGPDGDGARDPARRDAGRDPRRPRASSGRSTWTRASRSTSSTSCSRRARPSATASTDLRGLIAYGASPRASIALGLACRAHAFLRSRAYATPDDVRAVALDVLRHRVAVTYEAEAEEVTPEQIVGRVLDAVPVP